MKDFFKWFAGFFEDQAGSASSKRVILYVFLLMFVQQVEASIHGTAVNETIFFGTIGTIFAISGLTIPEWFSPKGSLLQGAKIESKPDEPAKTEPAQLPAV